MYDHPRKKKGTPKETYVCMPPPRKKKGTPKNINNMGQGQICTAPQTKNACMNAPAQEEEGCIFTNTQKAVDYSVMKVQFHSNGINGEYCMQEYLLGCITMQRRCFKQ